MKPHRSAWLLSLFLGGCILSVLLANFFIEAPPLSEIQAETEPDETPPQVKTPADVELIKLAVIYLQKQQAEKTESVEALRPSVAADPAPPSPVSGRMEQTNGGPVSIVGDFACDKSFYLQVMREQGALLVLYDKDKKLYYELLPDETTLKLQKLPSYFSRSARRLTQDYPNAQQIIAREKRRRGGSSFEILMLWPVALETKVENFIHRALSATGVSERPEKAWVRYRQQGGQLIIDLEQVLTAVGKTKIHQNLIL